MSIKLATNIHHVNGNAEKMFKVRGQRSRSCLYEDVNAIAAEEYISTVWRRGGSLVSRDTSMF